jgi:hypothetical protein
MKKAGYLLSLLFCIVLFSCKSGDTKHWKEVTKVDKIEQGTLFKIEPLKDTVLVMSGTFSNVSIDFKCTSLKPATSTKYRSAVSLQSSHSAGISSFVTTENGDLAAWPMNLEEQNIKIPIIIFPSGTETLKGSGQVYIYLVDSEKKCISNIIAWEVKFF